MDYFLTFERASGECINTTTNNDDIPRDPAVYVALVLPRSIDYRTERWDGALGVRSATAIEIAAWDAKQPKAQRDRIRQKVAAGASGSATLLDVKGSLSALGTALRTLLP